MTGRRERLIGTEVIVRSLDRSGRPAVVLHRWLANHPRFFIDVLSCAYRSENEGAGETEMTEEEQARA